jgi:tRNA uridine 5-carboxymethylaminomethyl modification enzyme
VREMRNQMDMLTETLKQKRFTLKDDFHLLLEERGYSLFNEGISAYDCLKRPRIEIKDFASVLDLSEIPDNVLESVEIEVKYEGYIVKALKEVERLKAIEHLSLPIDLDYALVTNLSIEGRQKLTKIRPLTLGQAARISGVNPADIVVLRTYLNQKNPSV